MLILNDLHLGARRKGGTTPASQEALRAYQFASLNSLLAETNETHLLILGDLLDDFSVDTRDLVASYQVLDGWLQRGHSLTLIAGNHDTVERGEKVSSFSALCAFLLTTHPKSVSVVAIGETSVVSPGVWAVAHHANQDLFNTALTLALDSANEYQTLLLHCNLDNTFAQRSDHSLDLSAAMANKFKDKGVSILLAHEHNNRVVGNVTVLGCQFPSSVADCAEADTKFAHTLNDGVLTKVPTWATDIPNGYVQIDWRELGEYAGAAGFIRVSGEALATEAADVIGTIAKFRQRSTAFVITNAVAIDGIVQVDELPAAFEAAKAFDVVSYIHKNLSAEEVLTFDKLLEQSS